MASRGKEFEKHLKKALVEVPDSYTLRLTDSFGFTENPSDFIFFKSGILYLIEAKSHEGNVFPLKMIEWGSHTRDFSHELGNQTSQRI